MSTVPDFEKASRLKLRFETTQGPLSVEDLWVLPLVTRGSQKVSLDMIAVALHSELTQSPAVTSFVTPDTHVDVNKILQLKFDIVRHIIAVRVAENETAKQAAEKRAKKEQLLELISRKEEESLANLPVEQLRQMVENL